MRKLLVHTAGAACIAIGCTGVASQPAYPAKPIRLITPFAPGGTTTVLARLVTQRFSEAWGQPVLVDHRPGANTIIGTEALAKSAADGYTIMLMSVTHVIIPSLLPLPYDPLKDFAPVSSMTVTELVLAVHPSLPADSVRALIALAKSRPGQLNFSTGGSGGTSHLAGELFNIMNGVKTQSIPYKGNGPAVTDLIGGQVQMSYQGLLNVVPHLRSGRLKALAITGDKRSAALPRVPTFTEAGLPGFDVRAWQGIIAPVATPRPIVDRLAAEVAVLMNASSTRDMLQSQGVEAMLLGPEAFGAMMKADMAKYARIIKTAHIRIEN